MKQSQIYAKRIRQLYNKLLRQFGKQQLDLPREPLMQLVEGILAPGAALSKAQAVARRLCQGMVDLNELRVTPPMELAALIGDSVPFAAEKAQRIVSALNAIRVRQDTLDLSFLQQRGRREARDYLESLAGVDRSAAALVVLYSLGGHAVPVDPLTVHVLKKDDLIDASADLAETQGFLERTISAAEAPVFAELLSRYVSAKIARFPADKLAEIYNPSPPPPPQKPASGAKPAPTPAASAGAHKPPPDKSSKPASKNPSQPPSTHKHRPGKADARETTAGKAKHSGKPALRKPARKAEARKK